MEQHFKFNGGTLTIKEAWLSGELGTTIWDAVRQAIRGLL